MPSALSLGKHEDCLADGHSFVALTYGAEGMSSYHSFSFLLFLVLISSCLSLVYK